MNIIFVTVPFLKSVSQGWVAYYKNSRGPKFTEEQIRMSDDAATTLQNCFPVQDFLDSGTHLEICKNLNNKQYTTASINLESATPELDLNKTNCIEALKIGVWLLGTCAPESIREATLNLLACEYYFPTI